MAKKGGGIICTGYVHLYINMYTAGIESIQLFVQEEKNLIKVGARVVECGGAPGAWTQVIAKHIGN